MKLHGLIQIHINSSSNVRKKGNNDRWDSISYHKTLEQVVNAIVSKSLYEQVTDDLTQTWGNLLESVENLTTTLTTTLKSINKQEVTND